MSERHFKSFQELIYSRFGIMYKGEKLEMLQAKVSRQMRARGIESYDDFYSMLRRGDDPDLVAEFVDDITIHTTNFFRERHHFDFLLTRMQMIFDTNPRILGRRDFRAWSAACSTGEEAYSLAITLAEALESRSSFKVLATDVSRGSVATAQRGFYRTEVRKDILPLHLQKYFNRTAHGYEAKHELKAQIVFRLFNLADHFPFKGNFDLIMCRNVMIYFSPEMQQALLNKMYHVLAPGGLLFIGHSESLIGKQHRFKYIEPTIYQK